MLRDIERFAFVYSLFNPLIHTQTNKMPFMVIKIARSSRPMINVTDKR